MPTLTNQQQTQFKQLTTDRQQSAEVLEKQSMRGVKLRVIEKYSESAHFIYELLQNADDAKATYARIALNPNGILFAHNGTIHFTITAPDTEDTDTQNQRLGHINAITSIGNSNKYEAQIGKFGVGFKAVFQYTNTPEIYDPPFCFKIEKFIVPILLNKDHPDRHPEETLFYFPFDNPESSPKHAFQTILTKLQNLTYPLLFLRHLTQISWNSTEGNQGSYTKTCLEEPPFCQKTALINHSYQVKLIMTQQQLNNNPVQNRFLVFTRHKQTSSPESANEVTIAYLLKPSERQTLPQVAYQQTFPAYCFFPTKETTHLHFIVQAPFLLTDSREGIKHGDKWNQQLIEALALLTAESLRVIKQLGLLSDAFFNVLPINEQDFPTEHLFRVIYDTVLTQLQSNEALLPTQSGSYTQRDKAYLAENPELMNLLSPQQLSALVKNEQAQWVFPQTTHHNKPLWDYIRLHLVNQEVNSDKLARRLNKDFIQQQSDEWLMQFYTYLLEKARYLWKYEILKTKPILRLTDNQVVSAYNRAGKLQVYLPTESESEYPTIKACFVKHEKSLQFMLALGLDKPKAYEEIKYYILPRYKNTDAEIAPSVMSRDFKKLVNYFLTCPWQQQADYIRILKDIPFCRARYLGDNSIARLPPQQIYFKTNLLTNYFSHFSTLYFLDNEFYAPCYKQFGKDTLTLFFKALGIEDKPRRIKIKATLSPQQRETITKGQYTQDYYHFSQYTYDYDIEGLDVFLDQITPDNSKMLWQFLLKLIEENLGQEIFKGQYNWFYRRERYHHFDAKFLITLRQTAWLYNHHGNGVKPADAIVPELATNGYETESYAAKILIEKLQIPTEKLPDFTEEQRNKYVFGEAVFKLAKASGKEPTEVLEKLRHFLVKPKRPLAKERIVGATEKNSTKLTETKPDNYLSKPDFVAELPPDENQVKEELTHNQQHEYPNQYHSVFSNDFPSLENQKEALLTPLSAKTETVEKKRAQLEQQFAQQLDEMTQIEALKSQIKTTAKYRVDWFKALLELEYQQSHDDTTDKPIIIKFSQIETDRFSDKMILLKNPSRAIPSIIEDMADLSLQLSLGTETQTVLIEVVSVKELTLRARLKSAAQLKDIDLNQVQTAILEIKNIAFTLEKLKEAFWQLRCSDNDNLQTKLPTKIEFILGPPGTGKTTYLVKERIIPLLAGISVAKHQVIDYSAKILVLTPTNKVADVLVKKIMAEMAANRPLSNEEMAPFQPETASSTDNNEPNRLIRFGVTGDSEIEKAGLLKDKSFEISRLTQCVVVTTVARFLYDGFKNQLLKAYDWDVIVFDEASMIMLAQIVYILYQQTQCYFIIGGDPFQIQPVVRAEEWRTENIYTLVGLNRFQAPKTVPHDFPITHLTTQYRSIPPLGALVSQFSYDGILTHHRQLTDKKPLNIKRFDLKEITIIKFPSSQNDRFDSLYRSQRLDGGGAYQIYSAIFTVELALFLAKHLNKQTQAEWKIGIVCPYLAQATLVDKMIATLINEKNTIVSTVFDHEPLQITTGTVHSFQGDEFDMILTLLNAPPIISPNIFLNNQNILNVAMSRAKDYLVLILPDIDDGLTQLQRLGTILNDNEIKPYVQQFTAAEVEQILFNQADYIQENSLVTTHQKINVYGKPEKKYQVSCSDKVVDIQLEVERFFD
jgi:flagellar biosynthesis GTPase FlhF